jgi:hypothetical protein
MGKRRKPTSSETNTNKNILVISHRRSGTHLTIDSIINNFSRYKNNPEINRANLDELDKLDKNSDEYKAFVTESASTSKIYKTHTHANLQRFFKKKEIKELFDDSYLIYVLRDGKDVLVSQYYFNQIFDDTIKDLPFSQYLKLENKLDKDRLDKKYNIVEYWQYHIKSWENSPLKDRILFITYEDFLDNYEQALKEISDFIEEPQNRRLTDVRRSKEGVIKKLTEKFRRHPLTKKLFKKRYTTVAFRKGGKGDWKTHFDEEALQTYKKYTV